MQNKSRQPWVRNLIEWARAIVIAVAIVIPFRSSIADWYDVPTGSMKPTILEGDRVFVNKLAYDLKVPFTRWRIARWSTPQRGDVVVFPSPANGTRLVKRVIGVPGDRLAMRNNRLYVNGQAVSYEAAQTGGRQGGLRQPERGYCFLQEYLPGKSHIIMLMPSMPSLESFSSVEVPPGCYFVMGDNRDNSGDSRVFGFVSGERIVGKATAVVLSLDRTRHYLPRWRRFFLPL
jgi:signal peptidase I